MYLPSLSPFISLAKALYIWSPHSKVIIWAWLIFLFCTFVFYFIFLPALHSFSSFTFIWGLICWSFQSVCMLSCVRLFVAHELYSLPGSPVHRIFQTGILKWVAISFSRGIFLTHGSKSYLLHLLHWQEDSLPLHHLGSPSKWISRLFIFPVFFVF